MVNYLTKKIILSSLFLSQTLLFAQEGEVTKLENITIQEETSPKHLKTEDLKFILDEVPGGTNLINLDKITSSKSSISKVLNYEPGIIVQEFFGGNDQPRINIRGSGIQDNPVNRGIQLLYDGLPLNHPDGSFIIGMLDPEQATHLSIYRGSNAMRYGSTTLGGAIDLNVRNTYNSPSSLGFEVGSFGFRKVSASFGEKIGAYDYYIYSTHTQQNGFRKHSEGKRDNLAFNLGYTSKNWDNRTYFNYTNNKFDIPFVLTKKQAIDNPTSVLGEGNSGMDELLNILLRKPKRNTKQYRIANKTNFYSNNNKQSIGFYAEQDKDIFRNPLTQTDTKIRNFGFDYSFDYNHISKNDSLTNYLLFISANKGQMPRTYKSINPITGNTLKEIADIDLEATNITAGGQVTQDITQDLRILGSVQWVLNKREITDEKNIGVLDSEFSYSVLNPKIGLIYEPDEISRYYINISSSSEAPNFWQLAIVNANPGNPLNDYLYINDLKMQKANTLEVGLHKKLSKLDVDLSMYYSKVKDELISVVGDFAVNGKTINYEGETTHKGIELALNYSISNIFSDEDRITSKLIYNYSDFTFDDKEYKGNSLAGVPVHLIQTELGYWVNNSWYLGTNLRYQPKDTYIDHLNTKGIEQDSYYLLGLETSYQVNDKLRVFLDLNNITDKDYQTAYVVRGQSATDLPNFIPGAGFNFSTGLVYKW